MYEFIMKTETELKIEYEQIQTIPLSELCAEENNLFPEFRNSSKRKRTEKTSRDPNIARIELRIKKKDYEHYKKIAEENGIAMSDFFVLCAKHGGVIQVDTVFLEEYIRKMNGYSNSLAGIISTILISKRYFPADLERIHELSQEVIKSNHEVKDEIARLCRQIRRMNGW